MSITPRVSVTQTYTDNALLSSASPRAEWITQVSPGIRIASQGGRIRGSLEYSLSEFAYANHTRARQRQNALNSNGTVELVDRSAYLDFSGQISQQSISALSAPTVTAGVTSPNSTETSTFRLSPYVRGVLGGVASYEVRYGWTITNADATNASDVRTREWQLRMSDATSGPFGWSADAAAKTMQYSLGRTLREDHVQTALSYAFTPQVNAGLLLSHYSDNFATNRMESRFSGGASLNWTVSPLTKVAAQLERRSFGHSHNLSFEHRTGRTAWRFSDSRSVTVAPTETGTTVVGTLGDLLFSQFAGVEPDPLKRATLVDQFMQTYGLRSDAKVISNFLSSSATLQRRQEVSVALLGVRDTVTILLSRSASSKLDTLVVAIDDFSTNSLVQQTGFTTSWAHRLTPDWTFNLSASSQRSASSTAGQGTSLRSVDLTFTGRLGRQVNGSIGARRVWFDSTTAPYSESAVVGSLSVQF